MLHCSAFSAGTFKTGESDVKVRFSAFLSLVVHLRTADARSSARAVLTLHAADAAIAATTANMI